MGLNNNNNLDIEEEQFIKMSSKDRDVMMVRNVIQIRKQLKDYKITKKIQYTWLMVLSTVAAGLTGIKLWFTG